RSETAAERPAFRDALRLRRCLVPADGFYEWADRGRGPRQPYHAVLPGGALFAIAGLFERWRGEDGALLESCVLLTVPADDSIGAIHDRMPAILQRGEWRRWLDPGLRDPVRVRSLLVPWAGPALALRAVSRRVNATENDDPECLAPLGPGPLFSGS